MSDVNDDLVVDIEHLRSAMIDVCRESGIPETDHVAVANHFLEGQLRGKTTHGIGKFCFESQFFSHRVGRPWVERDDRAVATINGNREVGPISAAFAVTETLCRAEEYGVAFVGLYNTQRYGILSAWSEAIAAHGMVGLVMNTSTADSTVGGSGIGMLGVNALSLAVPTTGVPFVTDLAMTVAPMGALWDARRGDGALPARAFLDGEGAVTDDCAMAEAALIFGGYKGLAISMIVQLLTGSHFGFPMGAEVSSVWQTGYGFMAIKPQIGFSAGSFEEANSRLIGTVRLACASTDIRVPGENARARRDEALASGQVRVSRSAYEQLRRQAAARREPSPPGLMWLGGAYPGQ